MSNALSLAHCRQMTNDLFAIARATYPNVPQGPVPVFEIHSEADRQQAGVGFDLEALHELPLGEALDQVFTAIAVVLTYYRLRGTPLESDRAPTFYFMVTCLALLGGSDPETYRTWAAQQSAIAQMEHDAQRAVKH